MNTWKDKFNRAKMLVGLTEGQEAKDTLDKKLHDIKATLAMINTELEKFESLNSPDWGHIGDLNHVDIELEKVRYFIREAQ